MKIGDINTDYSDFMRDRTSLSRRGMQKLDYLLLAVESIGINGSQDMLDLSRSIGLQQYFPNFVELWKCRCHNPMRKASRKGR